MLKNLKVISLLFCLMLFTTVSFGANANIDVQNVQIFNNTTTPDTKIDITWSNLVIGTTQTQQTSTITLDASNTGANGLDTGSLSANTWYYLYAIYDGNSNASLLSTSSTSPSMPAGYNSRRLISSFKTDASSHFYLQVQYDRDIFYQINDGGANRILSTWATATTFTTVNASNLAPPIVNKIYISCILDVAFNSSTLMGLSTRTTGYTSGSMYTVVVYTHNTEEMQVRHRVTQITNNSQQFDYKIDTTPSLGGAAIDIVGYYFPI